MRKVYQQLKKVGNKDVEDIMENGLRYMRTLHSQDTPEGALYSWQKTFPGKKSRKEVEASLEKLGFDQHEWLENGALRWHPRIILLIFKRMTFGAWSLYNRRTAKSIPEG